MKRKLEESLVNSWEKLRFEFKEEYLERFRNTSDVGKLNFLERVNEAYAKLVFILGNYNLSPRINESWNKYLNH